MMCHESETARLVPSQFGRESQDSCDFEARQLKLRSDKPCDHQSPRFDCCQESQEGLAGLADCCNVWHHCLLRCLGPIFGWLGFDILDGWWPERQMTSAEYVFYQAQQNHIKHVECITRAVKGKHVGREELRKAVLSFAGSDQCTEVTCAELKAMFYFAECQQDGHVFLSFLQTHYGLEAGSEKWWVHVSQQQPPASTDCKYLDLGNERSVFECSRL